MTFTTLTFILLLILVFASYWSTSNRSAQNALLVVASYLFYAWWDYRFCALMLISSLVDFGVGIGLESATTPKRKRLLLGMSLAANLGMLGFFKYFNFFAESAVAAANSIGWQLDSVTVNVVLPVGISFYTFQTLSYSIDVYRGHLKSCRSLLDYLAYVSFFPQLVAGPIERGIHLVPQFQNPRVFDLERAKDGCRQLLWGFFKKMVLADRMALIVDPIYANVDRYDGPSLALATVAFAFQIYFDFSAYSDIAIGTARLLGFDLMRNFAYPYFSQDMSEFWRRWHISLSTWFRDYVYIPLGGSRVSRMRGAINVLITFTVSGLWHGASWNFVIWGALNGLGMLPQIFLPRTGSLRMKDTPGGAELLPRPRTVAKIALTFLLANMGWVFFRSRTFGDAIGVFERIILGTGDVGNIKTLSSVLNAANTQALILVVLAVSAEWIQRRHAHPLMIGGLPRAVRWTIYTVVLWAALAFAAPKAGEFIYFQF